MNMKIETALDNANKKADSKNWRLMALKKSTKDFLFIVCNQVKENEFATHIYNANDDAFYLGSYFADNIQAMNDYLERN